MRRRDDGFPPYRVSARDLRALRFVGEMGEIFSFQLRAFCLPGMTKALVSRWISRWRRRGIVATDQINRNWRLRIRLTAAGKAFLVDRGIDEAVLFLLKKPTAPKDVAHRSWLVDVAATLASESKYRALPSWFFERVIDPRPPAIPDVLGIKTTRGKSSAVALEIDLGGESVVGIFAPKLARLSRWLESAFDRSGIVILTVGQGRIRRLETVAAGLGVPMAVLALPKASGPGGLSELRELLTQTANSRAQEAKPNILQLNDLTEPRNPEGPASYLSNQGRGESPLRPTP